MSRTVSSGMYAGDKLATPGVNMQWLKVVVYLGFSTITAVT